MRTNGARESKIRVTNKLLHGMKDSVLWHRLWLQWRYKGNDFSITTALFMMCQHFFFLFRWFTKKSKWGERESEGEKETPTHSVVLIFDTGYGVHRKTEAKHTQPIYSTVVPFFFYPKVHPYRFLLLLWHWHAKKKYRKSEILPLTPAAGIFSRTDEWRLLLCIRDHCFTPSVIVHFFTFQRNWYTVTADCSLFQIHHAFSRETLFLLTLCM